jgi:hypothetical protein
MSSAEHHRQVSMVRASLGLSPREGIGCWKRSQRGAEIVERPSGIRR